MGKRSLTEMSLFRYADKLEELGLRVNIQPSSDNKSERYNLDLSGKPYKHPIIDATLHEAVYYLRGVVAGIQKARGFTDAETVLASVVEALDDGYGAVWLVLKSHDYLP